MQQVLAQNIKEKLLQQLKEQDILQLYHTHKTNLKSRKCFKRFLDFFYYNNKRKKVYKIVDY